MPRFNYRSCRWFKPLLGFLLVVVIGENTLLFMRHEMTVIIEPDVTDHVTPAQPQRPRDRLKPPVNRTARLSPKHAATKPMTEREREDLYYRRAPYKVNPYRHTFINGLDGRTVCDQHTDIIIIVHSRHDYADRRAAIRDTWGSVARGGVWPRHQPFTEHIRLVFTFGVNKKQSLNSQLVTENRQWGDIVQGDFIEDYKNLTLKSMLDIRFAFTFCPSAKFMLKSDDDMIINLPHLLQVLKKHNMSRAIMGPYIGHSPVYRAGKWGVSRDLFPFKFYPPYEAGSAYVIAGELLKELYDTAEYVKPIHVDDAYFTGILGRILKVRHVLQPGFAYLVTKQPKICDVVNNKIVTGTRMRPDSLRYMWNQLKDPPFCPPEKKDTKGKKPR